MKQGKRDRRSYSAEYYSLNSDAIKLKSKKYREDNSLSVRAAIDKWRKSHPDYSKKFYKEYGRKWYLDNKVRLSKLRHASNLMRRYGITVSQYDDMLIAQSGRCGLCMSAVRVLHVDHDHLSGRVRGLLCMKCNLAVGHVERFPVFLSSVSGYLSS